MKLNNSTLDLTKQNYLNPSFKKSEDLAVTEDAVMDVLTEPIQEITIAKTKPKSNNWLKIGLVTTAALGTAAVVKNNNLRKQLIDLKKELNNEKAKQTAKKEVKEIVEQVKDKVKNKTKIKNKHRNRDISVQDKRSNLFKEPVKLTKRQEFLRKIILNRYFSAFNKDVSKCNHVINEKPVKKLTLKQKISRFSILLKEYVKTNIKILTNKNAVNENAIADLTKKNSIDLTPPTQTEIAVKEFFENRKRTLNFEDNLLLKRRKPNLEYKPKIEEPVENIGKKSTFKEKISKLVSSYKEFFKNHKLFKSQKPEEIREVVAKSKKQTYQKPEVKVKTKNDKETFVEAFVYGEPVQSTNISPKKIGFKDFFKIFGNKKK